MNHDFGAALQPGDWRFSVFGANGWPDEIEIYVAPDPSQRQIAGAVMNNTATFTLHQDGRLQVSADDVHETVDTNALDSDGAQGKSLGRVPYYCLGLGSYRVCISRDGDDKDDPPDTIWIQWILKEPTRKG